MQANQEIKDSSLYNFVETEAEALHLDGNAVVFDLCLTTGKNDDVYLVSLFRRFENYLEHLSGIYLNGYKQDNGNMWRKIFQTELTSHVPNDYGKLGITNMYATISTVSNEMIIFVLVMNSILYLLQI